MAASAHSFLLYIREVCQLNRQLLKIKEMDKYRSTMTAGACRSYLTRERIAGFIWQHLLLLVSFFIMTLGVALAIRSQLGSSVISSIPMVMALAGEGGYAPAFTIGEYTSIMNFVLVGIQILILRRAFQPVQLFQLIVGTVFGWMLDLNMWITSPLSADTLPMQLLMQFAGCVVLGIGIAFEIRCGSVTMPGEGVPAAITKKYGVAFPKAKIAVDISLVVIAVALGYLYFGKWLLSVIGPGTLFAMLFVGMMVRFTDSHIAWFDRVVGFRPGFRKLIYGLARYIRH